nr:hypothetical protein [uncultured Achromobacter sp.]
MAIFKVTHRANGKSMVVRAKCVSCARSVAVEHAGTEGTAAWRDPEQSSVELVRHDDRPGLILKSE